MPLGQESAEGRVPSVPSEVTGTFLSVSASVVDSLATLKHKQVLLHLIETLQQMFYDYYTNGVGGERC